MAEILAMLQAWGELLSASRAAWWALILLLPLTLIWYGANRYLWWLALPAAMLALLTASPLPWWVDLLVVASYGAPLVLLGVGPLRRQLLSAPLLAFFRRSMPEISATERDALEAGGTWFEAELFGGSPRWRRLFDLRSSSFSEAERAFLDGPVETLCAMLDDHRINQLDHDLPPEAWDFIRDQGFLGMIIPTEHGGKGFSQRGHAEVVMKIATRSIAAALTVMIPNSVGPGKLLLRYGTAAQRAHWLPRLARGEEIPCFALTGPEAGSDASAIPDVGVVERREVAGEQVLGIRLTFDKRYITLAPVATVLGLAFKLRDPDGLLGGPVERGISLALVPKDIPGVSNGERHDTMGVAFMNGPVRGRDVFVPMDALIGGADYAGKGWRMLMECLTDGRAISLPALSIATAKLACRTTGAYARLREQFRVSIADFEGVQEPLARIAGNTYLMDAARVTTLSALDAGEQPSVVSAIMKYNMTERARRSIEDAMDVHGGASVCMGPRSPLGQYHRFGPIAITVEGANILTRSLMTFGQGAVRCHPYLLAELEAVAMDGDESLDAFDPLLIGHLGHALRNGLRSLVLGLSGGRLAHAPRAAGPLRPEARQVVRWSAAFAFVTDVLLLHLRGTLKRRERISGRMADVISQLYLASCVLRRYHADGGREEMLDLARWGMRDALARAESALREVTDALPRWLGVPLRFWVMPWGRSTRRPDDELEARIAEQISAPSLQRDLLSEGMYMPQAEDQQLVRLERALAAKMEARAASRKLRAAMRSGLAPGLDPASRIEAAREAGALGQDEAELLLHADALRRDALTVDSWDRLGSGRGGQG